MNKQQLYLAKVLVDLELEVEVIEAITSLSKIELLAGLLKGDETR